MPTGGTRTRPKHPPPAYLLARDGHEPGVLLVPPYFEPAFGTRHRFVVLHGGRGGGKSVAAATYCLEQAVERPLRVLCAREIQGTIADSSHAQLAELVHDLGLEREFTITDREIVGANGSQFIFRGVSSEQKTAQGIKSLHNIGLCWVDEAQQLSAASLELLTPTIRAPGSRIIFTFNPTDPDGAVYRTFVKSERRSARVVQVNYYDNPWLPAELEEEREWDQANKPHLYAHKWLGEPQLVAEGALWSQQMVVGARVSPEHYAAQADPDDIVVAVDPAGSTGERSDYTGIVVMARVGRDGYVLHAERGKWKAAEWVDRAIVLHQRFRASRIAVEATAAAIETTPLVIQQRAPHVSVAVVNPSGKGSKIDRAGPVASLYTEPPPTADAGIGRIWHVGQFHDLEGEMLTFVRDSVRDDLVDALVWAAVELRLTRPFRDLSEWEFV